MQKTNRIGLRQPPWALKALAAILVLAAAMRLWGITFGLPYEGVTYNQVTWEESQEVHRAFKLGAGEYTWSFGKGGLYYLLFVEFGMYFVVSWLFGWVSDAREFALQVLQDRTAAYVMGRLTNVALGLMTYVVVFHIGKRLYDWRVGLVAATIGAAAYFHAVFSTVINVDIGMTLALWSSVLLYLKYEEMRNTKFLIISGILGGIAIAFKLPGVVVLPIVYMAIAMRRWPRFWQGWKEAAVFLVALLGALTLIAPEWTTSAPSFLSAFQTEPGSAELDAEAELTEDLDESILSVTIVHTGAITGYIQQLLRDYNLGVTLAALIGLAIGFWRRERLWIVLGAFSLCFLTVMSLSWRTQSEHYLLPMMPALWLFAGRAIAPLGGRHRMLPIAVLVAVIAVPVFDLVRHCVEKSHLDTRLVAKEWIEANVPSGAKLLIDGMQYRYIPSPPLNPDRETVNRTVSRASVVGESLGRGVSNLTLELYREALENVDGPTYELHSSMYGLKVEDLDYYVDNCFDYIITSSYITERYAPGDLRAEIYPQTAKFYRSLTNSAQVSVAFQVQPERWASIGPTITVYKVADRCPASSTG